MFPNIQMFRGRHLKHPELISMCAFYCATSKILAEEGLGTSLKTDTSQLKWEAYVTRSYRECTSIHRQTPHHRWLSLEVCLVSNWISLVSMRPKCCPLFISLCTHQVHPPSTPRSGRAGLQGTHGNSLVVAACPLNQSSAHHGSGAALWAQTLRPRVTMHTLPTLNSPQIQSNKH